MDSKYSIRKMCLMPISSIVSLNAQNIWVFVKWPFILHLNFWKSRSVSNLRKSSGPPHLIFFPVHLSCFFQFVSWIFSGLWYKSEKNSGDKLKKNQVYWKKFSCAGPEIFLRFETDLNFSRPWFSEIKVQNKWLFTCCKRLGRNFCNVKCWVNSTLI